MIQFSINCLIFPVDKARQKSFKMLKNLCRETAKRANCLLNKNVRFYNSTSGKSNYTKANESSTEEETTHFGFQTIKASEKEKEGKNNLLIFLYPNICYKSYRN